MTSCSQVVVTYGETCCPHLQSKAANMHGSVSSKMFITTYQDTRCHNPQTPVTSCHLPGCFVLPIENHYNTRHKNGGSQPVQNGPGDHITSCSLDTGEIIRRGMAGGRGVNLTTHFHLAPRLRVEQFLHYHTPFWCSRDNFTFDRV